MPPPISYLETGVIYRDDNLRRLSEFPEDSVDLIYLDPPFFSNRQYEVIWGDEAEVRSFEDRWQGGIQVYIGWMRDRAIEMHRLLKPTGTIYLHCDEHASHYLKVMMDEVFGARQFRNEVIWQRTAAKGDARRKFGSVHDTILVYGKTAKAFFQSARRARDEAYLERFNLDDNDGRGSYRLAPLDSPNPRPNLTYEYKGYPPPAKGWRVSLPVMEELDAEGRLAFPRTKRGRIARKHYLNEQPLPTVADVWTDITPLQSVSQERLGYPTQKPEALLERIIAASSKEGDVVLDPFCGCGTTLVAAHHLKRQWIGIDISPTAVNLMKWRLQQVGVSSPKLVGIPVSEEQLRALKPFEFQNWVIERVHGTHSPRKSGDMGIDGLSFFLHEPIQVKQSTSVGRNVVDNFETAVKRSGKSRGHIVAFSFTRGAYEEAARARSQANVDIELVTIASLLKGKAALLAKQLELPEPPMPTIRPAASRPTVEELVRSDLGDVAVA